MKVTLPAPDLRIYDNQVVHTVTMEGISIRNDVLFTNEKGEENESVQRRTTKTLQKLCPPLQRILRPEEVVLYAMAARSQFSILEQLTAAWWTGMLAACVLVVTNKRVLFFLVKRDGTWRESVRAVEWGDLEEIKVAGVLIRQSSFKFKNGTKATFTNVRRGDARKLAALAAALIPGSSGEQSSAHSIVQLCPDCCATLTERHYSCPSCGLNFKNEKTMVLRSIILPGGGYFYTGHPLVAIIPAVLEGIFLLEILLVLFAGLAAPKAGENLLAGLLLLAMFWALETSITILHCRRYIRDFIPEKRDPLRAPQAAFQK